MKLLSPLIEENHELRLVKKDGSTVALDTRPFESLSWIPLDAWNDFMEEGVLPPLDKVKPRYHWFVDKLKENQKELRDAYKECPLELREGLLGFHEIRSWGAIQEHAPLEDMPVMLELEEFHNLHLWVEAEDGTYAEILDVCDIKNLPRNSPEPQMVEVTHMTAWGKSVLQLKGMSMAVVIKTEHARERELLRGLEIVTSST